MRVTPLGDTTLILTVGETIDEPTLGRVQAAHAALGAARLPAVTELVPAYTTVTVFYDPVSAVAAGAPVRDIAGWLGARVLRAVEAAPARPRGRARRTVEIPVCYDAEFAPDLAEVAQRTGLPPAEVIRLHAEADYLVHLVGFAPGFPYLSGLPAALSLPRRAVPRKRVPAGSVAITGTQCGIYPIETPAGWNLIGRTPRRLFRPEADPPVLLQAGDHVRFRPITAAEFADWKEGA